MVIENMKRTSKSVGTRLACCVVAFSFVGWAQHRDRRQRHRREVVEAERAFAQAAATKGTRAAFLEFLADDGIIFQPGPVNGKQFWRDRPVHKGLLSWQPIFADVSAAGDLGYTTGPWEFRPDGPNDKPIAFGQYFTIWKIQGDHSWKVALDRGITNAEPTVTAQPLEFPGDDSNFDYKKINVEAGRTLMLKLESEFSRASSSQGTIKAFQAYLANDVRLLRDNSFPAVGKEVAVALASTKRGELTWQATTADISRSGDLGYSYGIYDFKPGDKAFHPEKGNYVRVWKRQGDGKWRVVIDILNPTPSS